MVTSARRPISNAGQRAALVALTTNYRHAATGGRPAKGNSASMQSFETTADRAKNAYVGIRTQSKADRVVKANRRLGKKVAAGQVSLNKALAQVTESVSKPKPKTSKARSSAPAHDNVVVLQKRIAVLRAELRGVKATCDTLIAEKSQLINEVKRLDRRLGKAR